MRFILLKLSMMKYIGKNHLYSIEKHKMQRMLVYFEIDLHFMKLNFYFNELYAVISVAVRSTCDVRCNKRGWSVC